MKKTDLKKSSGFFRGVFDGLRSTVSQPSSSSKSELECCETLKADHFQVATIVRHGFPHHPTALAFDPIQRLIAIGTKNGSLRVLGRPGVEIHVQHIPEYAVLQIIFLINEGSLVTVLADDSLHLWSLRSKPPEIVQSLKFQKERITYCHLTFQAKWLYIGTDRGNVHFVNVDTFQLSGYVINWNKAIDLNRKTHPGAVVHLSDCTIDTNKLLVGFESGCIVLWDLRNKAADFRVNYSEGLRSISWHNEGRQFICSHSDGSLTTWNLKGGSKPVSTVFPHSKAGNDLKPEPCKPIYKCEWRTVRNGDSYIIFSGGLPSGPPSTQASPSQPSQSCVTQSQSPKSLDKSVGTQSLTVIHGKTTTVLEMEDNIIDFITLCETAYEMEFSDPYAIVVLLNNDLVVVDLLSPGYPCFQNPYSMDLHESPVTYCYYLANCPTDLVHAFFTVGHKLSKRSGFSEKEWPINGGEWGNDAVSYPEMIITGHADGSIKFWDASSVHLHQLYKLKTAKLFDKPKPSRTPEPSASTSFESGVGLQEDDPFAIEQLTFSTECRYLCIAGASSQVIGFRFNKHEAHTEVPVIEIPMNYEAECESADNEIACGMSSLLTQTSSESHDNSSHYYSLQVKSGHHKRLPGFQAEFVCLSPWIDRSTAPFRITSLCVNPYANLVAYGTENGLIIIDTIQKCAVLNVSTSNLYGAADPYQRTFRSNMRKTPSTGVPPNKDNADGNQSDADRCKSPTSDQLQSPDTSMPSSPLMPKLLEFPEAPVPPPRARRMVANNEIQIQSQSTSLREADDEACNESCECESESESGVCAESVNINCDESVRFTKEEHNVRPQELNLQLKRRFSKESKDGKDTKDSPMNSSRQVGIDPGKDKDRSSPSAESDNQSVQSDMPSPVSPVTDQSSDQSDRLSQSKPRVANCDARASPQERFRKSSLKTKFKVRDLRPDDDESLVSRIINKIDSSFSRSRSSSISSLENISIESVLYLVFAETYCTKSDATTSPCLWVGTSLGSILVISLTLPDSADNRILCLQTVIASPTGSIYRLKGSILCISFLDFTGAQLQLNADVWRDSGQKGGNTTPSSSSSVGEKRTGSLTIVRSGSGGGGGTGPTNRNNKISPTSSSTDMRDSQFVVMVSEKQIRLVTLPAQQCTYKATLTETSFAVRADVVYMKSADSVCLAVYLGTGNIVVYSLPSLRLLIDIDFLPLTDVRIARTICFSANGHGLYMSSPSELTKFTISSSFRDLISDMIGALFTSAKELPEPPKPSFLKGLFGGGTSSLDREELFGETSAGKPSKAIARHIPGTAMEQAKLQSNTLAGDMARLREGVTERGERLGHLEDKTARMQSEAEVFGSAAHQVMLKYRDKKWYQF